MRKKCLFWCVGFALSIAATSVMAQEGTSPYAISSDPSSVGKRIASEMVATPEKAPSAVLEAMDLFCGKLSGEDLEKAVASLFEGLGKETPDLLEACIGPSVAKYPKLALSIARGALLAAPARADAIAYAVIASSQSVNPSELAKLVAEIAGGNAEDLSSTYSSWSMATMPVPSGFGGGRAARSGMMYSE